MIMTDLEFFQDIQNVYSTLTNLHIAITDKDGNQITQLSKNTNINQERAEKFFSKITRNYPKMNEPILYESLPEVKIIVCPIILNESIEYFIFAGCLIGISTTQTVQTYLTRFMANMEEKQNLIFSLIKECNPDELKDMIKKIKQMSELLSDRLLSQKLKFEWQNQDEIFEQLADEKFKINDLLKKFYDNNAEVDFVGYARKISSVQFEIKEFLPAGSQFSGTRFVMGEGFLGQVAVTSTGDFWSEVEWDPRNKFFHNKGLFPKSVFCFPIIRDNESVGLFFGGSNHDKSLEKNIRSRIKLTASLMMVVETKRYWQEKAMLNQVTATVVKDIFHTLAALKDINSVQVFVLDTSLSLTQISFVSVVFFGRSNHTFEVVSRGLVTGKIEEYKRDITDHYLKNRNIDIRIVEPSVFFTKSGDNILEIPICYQKNMYGYLCIMNNDELNEDRISLLKILADASGVALHRLSTSQDKEIDESMINTAAKLLEINNPKHLVKASMARQILKEFGQYQNDPRINIPALKLSCYLSVCDEQYLFELKEESIVLDILREYLLVIHNHISLAEASINVQLLILVWTYVSNDQNSKSISKMNGINDELMKNFTSYVSDKNVKENENVKDENNGKVSEKFSIDHGNLTKREIEVLMLVLEGKNNREIAGLLYISGHTVKNHMTNIFHKLKVNDRTQVIAKIYQAGFKQM